MTIDDFMKSLNSQPLRLRPKQAKEVLGVSIRCLEDWRTKGKGPTYTKIGRKIYYEIDDLATYLAENKHASPLR